MKLPGSRWEKLPGSRWDSRTVTILAGTYGVVAASAALSFESLRGLGKLVGYSSKLANGLPISIDLYAAVVSLIWLGPGNRSDKIRKWAKYNTIFSAVLSIVCNALYHALLAGKFSEIIRNAAGEIIAVNVDAKIVVGVGAMPPIILVLVVHLLSLLAEDKQVTSGASTPRPSPAPRAADVPVTAVGRPVPPTAPAVPAAEIPAQKRPELPPSTPKPGGSVAPLKPVSDRKAKALVEFARLEAANVDISRPGFNDEMAGRYGVSLRSVEGWKKEYKALKASRLESSG
ncbi:DUF2637 domain-containing protein [Protofrankia symbiont of Coriaria ruscifolia]|uniref:Putative membrane protein n=1 Tax=Candidatus Protofrankia californiensis TaxID=1839754 RepID=A0A1C3PBW0_9ACTN|nr:DUF2637 domain-containing protein [Protofrankia symbiont of Coriaria ruscifolia]SBW27325.1 putative membrane protein [Candidatus Protofrankia californiensis]